MAKRKYRVLRCGEVDVDVELCDLGRWEGGRRSDEIVPYLKIGFPRRA